MAIREYKCECGYLTELILPITEIPLEFTICKNCQKNSKLVQFSRTSFVQSNFQNAPIDIVVGADAHKKWDMYNRRQEDRNKIRKETGSLGLTELGEGEYIPVPESVKTRREAGALAASTSGIPQDTEMVY